MIENRMPMLSQGQNNPFAFSQPNFDNFDPNNRNISATPTEGLSLEKMHSPYAGLASLAGPMFPQFMPQQMPQQQSSQGNPFMSFAEFDPFGVENIGPRNGSPIGQLLQPPPQSQPSALPSFGDINNPSISDGSWDSTMAGGYTPPTAGQYGAGLWDFFANQMPWTIGGAANQLTDHFSGGPSLPDAPQLSFDPLSYNPAVAGIGVPAATNPYGMTPPEAVTGVSGVPSVDPSIPTVDGGGFGFGSIDAAANAGYF